MKKWVMPILLSLFIVGVAIAQPFRTPVREINVSGYGGSPDSDLDLNGHYLYDSTSPAQLGGAATTTHSLGTGDVIIADALEINGNTYLDGITYNFGSFCNSDNYVWGVGSCAAGGSKFQPRTDFDELLMISGPDHGRQWVIVPLPNKDYDHADISRPALYIHSETDPDTDNTQYLGWYHDINDAYVQVGKGTLKYIDNSSNCLWKKEYHAAANSISPGASGATLNVGGPGSATLYYLLDATTEYLYVNSDIHNDWDASSDIIIEARVALNADETANDIIQAEVISEYVGEHEDMDISKTQTRSIDHNITTDNLAGAVHEMIFLIDYDLASNVVEVNDILSLRFRLDSVGGGTDVAAVRFLTLNIYYRACTPSITMGSFPSEG